MVIFFQIEILVVLLFTSFVVLAAGFPELGLTVPSRFKHAPFRGYWKDKKNHRLFFDQLAAKLSILDN